MTLDEQLSALCRDHNLTSMTITTYGGPDSYTGVSVQWSDPKQIHGLGCVTADYRIPIADGIKQAIERANEQRVAAVAVPELAAA